MASCSRTKDKSVYSIVTCPESYLSKRQSDSSLDILKGSYASSKVKFAFGKPVFDEVSSKAATAISRPSLFSRLNDISLDTISKGSHQLSRPIGVDVFGVRVVPAAVSFINTFENQSYVDKLFVQNISKTSVIIRIHNPRAWSFRLTPIERGVLLAPGLKITRHIHFTCTKLGIVHSTLPIFVNDKCFELPLESTKGQAFVEIVPTSIDFGRVDIGSKPVERKVVVRNVSSCATKFLVDLGRNELQLQVTPLKGWIRPHSSVTIRIQLIALEIGDFSSEIWITTDLCQSRIPVEVLACERSLLVLHPNSTSDLTLIDFPKTFYGCRRYQTIVVYNMAAASSAFVVLADFGNEVLLPMREARKMCTQRINMFNVEPDEGRIRPFEGRIFTVWFQPTPPEEPKVGWKHQITNEVRDVLCAVRIKRIQVDDLGVVSEKTGDEQIASIQPKLKKQSSIPNMEFLMQEVPDPKELPPVPISDDICVVLCLYGEAESPDLSVLPDRLDFSGSSVGAREDKIVRITNNSSNQLAFRSVKIPFFDISPNYKKISPKETCDVNVTYCPRSLGNLPKKLVFEVLAYFNSTDEKDFQVVNNLFIKICGKVKADQVIPQPKFNPGITPMITNEVGFLTEQVTFISKVQKPNCAMLGVSKIGRPWVKTSATIAFPNDMPLTLRPRETDTTAKTIFKGLNRYVAPIDESFTYTMEQLLQKKANDFYFLNYVRGTAAVANYNGRDHCCKLKIQDREPDPPLLVMSERKNVPRDVLVPLSFVQLYRIRVYPILISFGCVTTNKNCTQILTIDNQNEFQISAKVLPLTSGIHIQTLDSFTIKPKSEAKVKLTFHRETLGRYSGTISCVVNGHHSFDIAVVAEVVPKTLSVSPDRVEYRLPSVPFALGFVSIAVQNQLNTPVSFSWQMLDGSPFKVEPVFGVTPRKGMVWCAVYFEPGNPNYKLHPLRLLVEGVTCQKIKTGALLGKPMVHFLEPSLNIGYIPLRLTTVKKCLFFNPDFCDVMFVILNKEPIKGVTVEPSSGTVKARSCHAITLHICVSKEGHLDFVVYMTCQNSLTIEMKVTANAVYPQVDINPKLISLTRVPSHSVITTRMSAENKSKARAEVKLNVDEYPQFKVSLSKSLFDDGIPPKGLLLEPGVVQRFYLHFIPKDLTSYDFMLPVVVNQTISHQDLPVKELEVIAKKIRLSYRKTSSLKESGKPPPNPTGQIKFVPSHMVLIDVVVLKPQLLLSETELYFTSTSDTKSFLATNVCDDPLNLVFRFDEANQTHFTVVVNNGKRGKEKKCVKLTVMPGDSVKAIVKFSAAATGTYVTDVTVDYCVQDHPASFNFVRMSGTISPACTLSSSVGEIYFTPVPLGIETNFYIYLTVNSQSENDEITITYELNCSGLFKVDFPRGNMISYTNSATNVIPVKVTFISNISISTRKMITFRANKCSECTVVLYATSDNCLFTTHAFVKTHLSFQSALKDYECLENTDSNLQLSKDENLVQPYQQVFGQSSKQDNTSSGSSVLSSLSLSTAAMSTTTPNSPAGRLVASSPNRVIQDITDSPAKLNSVTKSDLELTSQLGEKEDKTQSSQAESSGVGDASKEQDESTFPLFPMEPAITEYGVHMNRTLHAVETWAYEQVFNCSYHPIFGSYSFSVFTVNKKQYGGSISVAFSNVFDVLERICGRTVRRYFTPLEKLPEDVTAKAHFTYNVYKQLLDFMVVQGALLCHVDPKCLMTYDDYCAYCKSPPSTFTSYETTGDSHFTVTADLGSEKLDYDTFKSISIQCWLDLFLQIFKVFILNPLVGVKINPHVQEASKRSTNPDLDVKRTVCSRSEDMLMAWLSHNFNSQRLVLWPEQPPSSRTVKNFDSDLEDGLVLTAATAVYCPYLIPLYFQNMFSHPTTVSHAYHNTVCLTMAWDQIKLGFSVTPRDFGRPNPIKMIMLVVHLYKTLPSYQPEAIVKFNATLNSSETQVVTLENLEESTVTYTVQILPNTSSFVLEDSKTTFVLKRKQKGHVTVRYTARNATKVDAILLLCGASVPPKFGPNYTFALEGNPGKLPVTSVFKIISPLNMALSTSITIESPHSMDNRFEEVIQYDIWVTETEPQPGDLNALRWAKERKRKIPRRLFILSEQLSVEVGPKQKIGKLLIQVCCFSPAANFYWLLFMNPEIGDFIVKLQITAGPPEPSKTLVAIIPESRCSCISDTEMSLTCSRTAVVNIPCRNLDQWAAVRAMFELTISPSEREFWTTYIESHIGLRLLQWMLEEKRETLNKEIELIFKQSKTYNVSCKSPLVYCSPILDIPDVRSKGSVSVLLHCDEDTPNCTTTLTLTSSDEQEIRCYNLNIISNY